RMHETGRLHAGHAGGGEPVAQLGPRRRLQDPRLVLQAVPRPHIDDRDAHVSFTPCLPGSDYSGGSRPDTSPYTLALYWPRARPVHPTRYSTARYQESTMLMDEFVY